MQQSPLKLSVIKLKYKGLRSCLHYLPTWLLVLLLLWRILVCGCWLGGEDGRVHLKNFSAMYKWGCCCYLCTRSQGSLCQRGPFSEYYNAVWQHQSTQLLSFH
jgi:hypothetical protein